MGISKERMKCTLTMTPAIKQRFDALMQISQSETLSVLFQKALAIYEVLMDVYREDSAVVLKRKDGREQEIVLDIDMEEEV